MYTNAQRRDDPEVQELRRAAGEWLRSLRERRGLSQRELAKLVGADYYTFISQLETGRGRVPPDRYELWAKALGISPREFVRTMLRYYDPVTYGILFDADKPVSTTFA
jgi:transcriptional regulator with XRE-family HTH domain